MKKFIFTSLTFAWFLLLNANVNFSGFVRNYSAILFEKNHDFALMQNTFEINFYKTTDKIAFKVNPYFSEYDERRNELGLREAFLDIYLDALDIRIGKQQIIWGKADGVFITDIVSPKDLREFLILDFREIRQAITSLKVDYYIANNTFELVWIPEFSPNILPNKNSIWYQPMNFPIEPQWDLSKQEVEPNLHNSEVFAKFSAMTSVIDYEVMAGYMWDDEPSLHIKASIDSVSHLINSLIITPRHHRLNVFGGSFSSSLGKFVFRGEGAYYLGKYFQTDNFTKTDALSKKNYINYLFGIDTDLFNAKLSGQFIRNHILNYEKSITRNQFENLITLLISKTFLNETLKFDIFEYFDFNNKDTLIKATTTYNLTDGFDITLGTNIFCGAEGKFGQYNKNDMAIFKVKYSF